MLAFLWRKFFLTFLTKKISYHKAGERMSDKIKETLEKQLDLLSERSSKSNSVNEIVSLTEQMISLAKIIEPELQCQSVYAATYPYVGHLSMSDLESLALARQLRETKQLEAERQWCKDHEAKFVQT